MLKSTLTILATSLLAASSPSRAAEPTTPPSTTAQRSFPGLFGEDGPVRRAVRNGLQRLLAFRSETPLNAEQRTQVRAILEKHRSEIRTQFSAGREARLAMHKAVQAGSNGEDEAARIGETARTGALLHAQLAREIRPVLTPEQRQRLDSAYEQFQAEIGQVASLP